MARKYSPSYNSVSELKISSVELERRWRLLGERLRIELGLAPGGLLVQPDYALEIVAAGFVGSACEVVERHQGRHSPVAPLTSVGRGSMMSWLGFHEVWESRPSKSYVFQHVSLTVHVGYQGDVVKPQIFRSEWPGVRGWTAGEIGFQAPGAGHPHWQFDAMRSVRDYNVGLREKSLARLRHESKAEEFSPSNLTPDILADLQEMTLERIHFASAAPWWLLQHDRAYDLHMNAPSDPEGLLRWIIACVAYIRQELKRC
jgi:hypothetical protein